MGFQLQTILLLYVLIVGSGILLLDFVRGAGCIRLIVVDVRRVVVLLGLAGAAFRKHLHRLFACLR